MLATDWDGWCLRLADRFGLDVLSSSLFGVLERLRMLLVEATRSPFGLVVAESPSRPIPGVPDVCGFVDDDDPAKAWQEASAALEPERWRARCAAERVSSVDGLDLWLGGLGRGVT